MGGRAVSRRMPSKKEELQKVLLAAYHERGFPPERDRRTFHRKLFKEMNLTGDVGLNNASCLLHKAIRDNESIYWIKKSPDSEKMFNEVVADYRSKYPPSAEKKKKDSSSSAETKNLSQTARLQEKVSHLTEELKEKTEENAGLLEALSEKEKTVADLEKVAEELDAVARISGDAVRLIRDYRQRVAEMSDQNLVLFEESARLQRKAQALQDQLDRLSQAGTSLS